MRKMKYCVVVPVYNSETHVSDVINDVLQYTQDVIVVNDGSTDATLQVISRFVGIDVVSYSRNRGKGYAISKGLDRALKQGFTHAVTIDADGQHKACDIPKLVETASRHEEALIIGSRNFGNPYMPQGNRFANRFSNFWFRLQTGIGLPDTQTGFRLYPLLKMGKMRPFTRRYEAELELLVRAAWRNIELIPTTIDVYYPPSDERISHFRKGRDFVRISLLNTALCIIALVYGYPSMFVRKLWKKFLS